MVRYLVFSSAAYCALIVVEFKAELEGLEVELAEAVSEAQHKVCVVWFLNVAHQVVIAHKRFKLQGGHERAWVVGLVCVRYHIIHF